MARQLRYHSCFWARDISTTTSTSTSLEFSRRDWIDRANTTIGEDDLLLRPLPPLPPLRPPKTKPVLQQAKVQLQSQPSDQLQQTQQEPQQTPQEQPSNQQPQQQQQQQQQQRFQRRQAQHQILTSYPDGDSLERFTRDVKIVCQNLRPSHVEDHAIPSLFRQRRPSFTSIWDKEDWAIHTSRKRYLRYILEFPTSRLLRRCLPQMGVLLLWSLIAMFIGSREVSVAKLHIGLTPMSLISTFVAALLTLRSNQGLSRLTEARNAFGQVVLLTREMAQLISTSVYPVDPQMGLLAARHVTIFGWSLKAHLRETTCEDIIRAMLPQDAAFVANYPRKPPAAIIMRLRQIFEYLAVQGSVDKEVHKLLLQTTSRLNEVLMISERIRNSPIPPLYTAHTTRLLVFYLFWLPLALYDGTSILLGKTISTVTSTLLVTLAAGYAMLGLDEISHVLELPFKLMPLRELSKMSMIDSADAMVYRPPPLALNNNEADDDEKAEDDEGTSHVPSTQIAW